MTSSKPLFFPFLTSYRLLDIKESTSISTYLLIYPGRLLLLRDLSLHFGHSRDVLVPTWIRGIKARDIYEFYCTIYKTSLFSLFFHFSIVKK